MYILLVYGCTSFYLRKYYFEKIVADIKSGLTIVIRVPNLDVFVLQCNKVDLIIPKAHVRHIVRKNLVLSRCHVTGAYSCNDLMIVCNVWRCSIVTNISLASTMYATYLLNFAPEDIHRKGKGENNRNTYFWKK